jgi:hypothetical protein
MSSSLHKIFLTAALTVFCLSANAELSDAAFVAQFAKYRMAHRISTLKTVQAFAAQNKMKPEVVLKRYISVQWATGASGQRDAVMSGLEAYEQSGKTHAQALEKISEIVGQLDSTLEAIYRQAKIAQRVGPRPLERGIAFVNPSSRSKN